jgi:hypothetical protein
MKDGRISIEVSQGGEKHPCAYGIAITHTIDGKIYPDWGVDLEDKNRSYCTNKFTYPDAPPHYYPSQPASGLKPGTKYDISVSGVGFGAGTQFVKGEQSVGVKGVTAR